MHDVVTLETASQQFLEYLKSIGKSTRTLYTYGKDLEQVKAFFGQERALTSILKVHVGKFYKSPELLQKPDGSSRADMTLRKTVRVFRMLMVWAQAQGYIEELPLTKDTPMGRSLKATNSIQVDVMPEGESRHE